MTSSTGGRRRSAEFYRQGGFTLIELILVMALLVVVLAVGAPTLAAFFSGRTINSEAKRFMSLTRYAQSQAVSRGMPMELWLDRQEGRYGLRVQEGYDCSYGKPQLLAGNSQPPADEERPLEFQLGKDLDFDQESGGRPPGDVIDCIRFLPDGSIDDGSLDEVVILQGSEQSVRVRLSDDQLNFVIDENKDVR